MVGNRVVPTGVAMGLVAMLAGCGGSSSDTDTDTVAFVPEVVSLDDLPGAAGRSAFAISEDAAIVGGGAVQQDPDNPAVPDGPYRATDGLWTIDAEGNATTLPPLEADGMVLGLSGTQVDDTMVLAGMDCEDNMSASFGVPCAVPRRPAIWTMEVGGDRWNRHDFPNAVNAPWSDDLMTSGTDLFVLGNFEGKAYLSLTTDQVTRFLVFDPTAGSFELRGDGVPTSRSSADMPYCLADDGAILQLRVNSGGADEPDELMVAQLDPEGTWVDGPNSPMVEGPATRPGPSISCLSGEALVLLPVADIDTVDPRGEEDIDEVEIVNVNPQSLTLDEDPDVREILLDTQPADSPNVVSGDAENGWIIQFSGKRLMRSDAEGQLEDIDHPDLDVHDSLFLHAGDIGTINHLTGEVNAG